MIFKGIAITFIIFGDYLPLYHPSRVVSALIGKHDISEIEADYKGGGTSSYNLRKYIALGAPGRSVAVGSCL